MKDSYVLLANKVPLSVPLFLSNIPSQCQMEHVLYRSQCFSGMYAISKLKCTLKYGTEYSNKQVT
jgi:hypothetical protein